MRKPVFIAASKVTLGILLVSLYIMQFNVAYPLFGVMNHVRTADLQVDLVFIQLVVSLVIGFVAFVLAIIGGARTEFAPLMSITIGVKLLMIPFFGINIYLGLFLLSGMLNPFLLLGIPAAGGIGIVLTYIYMLMTGLPDVIYSIIFLIRSRKKPSVIMVVGMLMMFVFVLDIVGAFLLKAAYRKLLEQA